MAEKKEEAYEPQSDLFDNIIECLYTDYSITLKELAELYSFSDSYHLSRTFKHFKGVSPREFKESSDYI